MHPQFDLPSRGSIKGRSSSITAAFFQAITPVVIPSDAEVDEALGILGMSSSHCHCAYCGDVKTEWDHFRAIVDKQRPTGYITEIANLVPACGKCNQSKGSKGWKAWMLGPAARSPATRGVPDLELRVSRLDAFSRWREPSKLDYAGILGPEAWEAYMSHWKGLLAHLAAAQTEAAQIRQLIEKELTGARVA
jgi:hypothetical protein